MVDSGQHFGVSIDAVEHRPLVTEVGETASALFLMDFKTGVDPFFLAQFLKAVAQCREPFIVDKAWKYGVALLVEIVSVLLGQQVVADTQGVQCACNIHYSFASRFDDVP